MDLNRATVLGRLTRDPEVRTTPSGKSVASITIATGRVWTDASGARQEKTEFSNCVLWGRQAEIAGQYLSKGRRIYLEGRLQTRDWTGQDGVKRYRTEIISSSFILLDSPRAAGNAMSAVSAEKADANLPSEEEDAGEEIKVEDIPF